MCSLFKNLLMKGGLIMILGCSIVLFFILESYKQKLVGNKSISLRIYQNLFRSRKDDLMEETLKIFYDAVQQRLKICLLEPRILFNSISNEDRQKLKHIGFELDEYKGADNVYSLAVFETDVAILNDIAINTVLEAKGFEHWAIKSHGSEADKQFDENVSQHYWRTTHFLYLRDAVILHVVVLCESENYFWQEKISALPPEIAKVQNYEKFLYIKEDSTYSRFNFTHYPYKDGWNNVYIPSDAPKFLSQLQTARFIPCSKNSSTTANKNQTDSDKRSLRLFENTTVEAIKELESLLDPTLTQFWLASGTLLGWYRECGIIPYTSDLDFAVWNRSLNEDLIDKFKTSKNIELKKMFGKISVDLEFFLRFKWLRVDIFFVYKGDGDTFYCGGHAPNIGYSFKYVLPRFSLCSGDLLGQRVTVPCNAEDIIKAEYGENWRIPVKKWDYDLSAKNVFGRRYWDEEEKKTYKNFPSKGKRKS